MKIALLLKWAFLTFLPAKHTHFSHHENQLMQKDWEKLLIFMY